MEIKIDVDGKGGEIRLRTHSDATVLEALYSLQLASAGQATVLRRVEAAVTRLSAQEAERGRKLMNEMDDVVREVAETGTVMEGASVLLGTLASLITANATNPEALRKVASDLNAMQDRLGAAILQNTPAAAVEPPVDTPPLEALPPDVVVTNETPSAAVPENLRASNLRQ